VKVVIGPYKRWFGPYQIANLLKYVGVSEERCFDIGGMFPDWFNRICQWFYDNPPRKVKVRIDEYDTWSMDHTLALIIHPMLLQLKATKHGSPFVADEDVPEELRSTNDTELTDEQKSWGETDKLFHERWEYVLNEMIFAFGLEIDEDWENPYHTKGDYDAMNVVLDRQKNGFKLFGKYYSGLWD